MNPAACFEAVTSPGWAEFEEELAVWAATGHVARLWWRDDDAAAPTIQLDALLRVADGLPLGIAVIPAAAEPELAARLNNYPQATVLQHGWRHANHGGDGKKSEFPASRAPDEVAAELLAGRQRLAELFGDCFCPLLAPPWNRFAAEFERLLPGSGLTGLSGLARPGPAAPCSIPRLDVHLDLVDWRGTRGFIGDESALGRLVAELRARRFRGDAEAPIGILTHHLVMDRATADFLTDLLDLTRPHPAIRWLGPAVLVQGRC